VKIRVKATMRVEGIPSEIEIHSGRLRDALDVLFRNSYFAKEVVDERTGELAFDGLFKIYLNGVYYHSLPDGLDTTLRDNDEIALSLILLGGG
jgi:hypothetical protein